MKNLLASFALSLLLTTFAQAQNPSGIYMLLGVMETAAGFKLNEDHTFEYFFIYGAADKWGKGTWKVDGKSIIFDSFNHQPAADFKLVKSSKTAGAFVSIHIADSLNRPYRYVACRLNQIEQSTDENGLVRFTADSARYLELYHPIFTTRPTSIRLPQNENDFQIQPTCDLMEVFFLNTTFNIGNNELTGTVLPGFPEQRNSAVFHFIKQQ